MYTMVRYDRYRVDDARSTMRDPFVADKTLDDLSIQFEIQINKKWHVDVFVWSSTEGLYNNTRWRKRSYLGAYIGNPGRNGKGLFGEIHLVLDEIGAGYVAHELAHCVYDWFYSMGDGVSFTMDTEKMAYLTGDITSNFWNAFYDRYRVVEGKSVKNDPNYS